MQMSIHTCTYLIPLYLNSSIHYTGCLDSFCCYKICEYVLVSFFRIFQQAGNCFTVCCKYFSMVS